MRKRFRSKAAAVAGVMGILLAACSGDDDTTDSTAEPQQQEPSGLLPDTGACDASLEPYRVGMTVPFETPVLSLKDQADGADAAVDAFNEKRSGIGGHCIELSTCDSQGDENATTDCVRGFVDDGLVADLNSIVSQGGADIYDEAGMPRVVNPGQVSEYQSPLVYALGPGNFLATPMMVSPLAREGITKIAVIHIDIAFEQILAPMQPMLDAYGVEITRAIPVAAGTTDFQQYVLAAEQSGAEGAVLVLGGNESTQILQAAQQLGSDLTFGLSLGTASIADARRLGDFAEQIVFNSDLPPAAADQERWPILKDVIADLSASGGDDLQQDTIKASTLRSWLAVYVLKAVVEEFGTPDTVSREAIAVAFDAATDVETFDLIAPWTPGLNAGGPENDFYQRVSNPLFYVIRYDADADAWVIDDKQLDVLREQAGDIEY